MGKHKQLPDYLSSKAQQLLQEFLFAITVRTVENVVSEMEDGFSFTKVYSNAVELLEIGHRRFLLHQCILAIQLHLSVQLFWKFLQMSIWQKYP